MDVLCIGNAIVDVVCPVEEQFLIDVDVPKGAMTLIDEARARELYDKMGQSIEISGGSAANTAAGLASLGSKVAFAGKVKADQLGNVFRHDITSLGIDFSTSMSQHGPETARCLILVTPDGERTMNTFLGACVNFSTSDINPQIVKASQVVYLEGYLWDPEPAKQAFEKAAGIAKIAGNEVSLTLSDSFCVDRHRASFLELIKRDVDILFANEDEIKSLYQVEHFDDALQHVRHDCKLAVLTRSAAGSVVVNGEDIHIVGSHKVDKVIDTTGAGDLYAAGFLAGYTRKKPLAECARLGSLAASQVISQLGARVQTNLLAAAQQENLL